MSNIQVFNNPKFGELRTSGTPDKPYFCLVDVCRALELENHRQVKTRLHEKGVITVDTLTSGGLQKVTFIDEPNFYRCVFQSRKDEAAIFQDWVFEEVLPTIRRQGFYGSVSENEILCKALQIANGKINKLENQIKRLSTPTVKEKAKRKQSSVDVSEWLKDQHIDALDDWCADGIWIPMVELVKNYLTYCVERKIRSLSPMILGRELNSRGYKRTRRNGRSFYYINKHNKQ